MTPSNPRTQNMTDEKVKEAVERLSKGLDAWCVYSGGVTFPGDADVRIADIRAILADNGALQAERDKLSAEVHQVRGELNEIGGKWVAEEQARRHLEAKLTALVEACQPFVNWAADNVEPDLQGPGFGIWSGNRCERERIVDWFGPSDFYGLVQALAHHSAPVGEEVVLFPEDGVEYGGLYVSAPPSTPTSAPVEDGGGLVKRLRDVVPYQGKSNVAFLCHEAADALERLASPALIQPQGEERS